MIGRLVFDNRKISWVDKIQDAGKSYKKIMGRECEVVFISRHDVGNVSKEEQKQIDDLPFLVRGFSIPTLHLWACVDDMEKELEQENL